MHLRPGRTKLFKSLYPKLYIVQSCALVFHSLVLVQRNGLSQSLLYSSASVLCVESGKLEKKLVRQEPVMRHRERKMPVWVKPSSAILFSFSFKFSTSFAEFSKVTWFPAYVMQTVSYLFPFPSFSYHAALPGWLTMLFITKNTSDRGTVSNFKKRRNYEASDTSKWMWLLIFLIKP